LFKETKGADKTKKVKKGTSNNIKLYSSRKMLGTLSSKSEEADTFTHSRLKRLTLCKPSNLVSERTSKKYKSKKEEL